MNPEIHAPQSTEPATQPPDVPANSEGIRSILSTLLILAIAPLIAWLMITFVFQSYEVDGPSMETTLQNSDRLIVLKTGRTWARLTNKPYIPERNDIVVFYKKGLYEFGSKQEKQLIKRVIGVPGDRIVVNNGQITVYNQAHPQGFNPDENTVHGKNAGDTQGEVDVTVPDGEVFVAGDNRPNSLDSRTFGTISTDEIVGKLVFRLFPLNKAGSF